MELGVTVAVHRGDLGRQLDETRELGMEERVVRRLDVIGELVR